MNSVKYIMTTSNYYHHCLRVAIYLFNKNWSPDIPVEIVGYDKPDFDLPGNFTFYSLGKQIGGAENFSTDLRPYFEKQDDFFTWMMDDTFVKGVDANAVEYLWSLRTPEIGRMNLCSRATKLQDHFEPGIKSDRYTVLENTQTADYRLCTQPSIWNRDYLLKYLTPGLTPWKFETQKAVKDGYRILGLKEEVCQHNEGVTKHDIYDYNLNGIVTEQIADLHEFGLLKHKTKR